MPLAVIHVAGLGERRFRSINLGSVVVAAGLGTEGQEAWGLQGGDSCDRGHGREPSLRFSDQAGLPRSPAPSPRLPPCDS